ncbi:MAG TPA: rhodanese-like domain-containing protein [Solirubrobacteraceae bacterium]|jgi:rhodanese-related sulfurtransferase|nr:rhodanese-like domain-containing protein [Solirubrobacteraceae bacterium]
MSLSLRDMMARARPAVGDIAPDAAAAAVEAGEFDLVIDVREPGEFAELHLAGATCIPRGLLERRADPSSPSADSALAGNHSARILVYCTKGPGARSLLAGETLTTMGFERVETRAGGLVAWSEAGLPVHGTGVSGAG